MITSPQYTLGKRFVQALPQRDPLRVAAARFRDEHLAPFALGLIGVDEISPLVGELWLALRDGSQLSLAEFCELAEINPVHQPVEALSFLLGLIGGAQ